MSDAQLSVVQPQEVTSFSSTHKQLIEFVANQLKLGVDYDIIPGTNDKKKSLLKPGAEKLAFFFGLHPEIQCTKEIEDWDKGFFYYRYKVTLIHSNSGKNAGEAERSCNSLEKKYRFKAVSEKYATDEQRAAAVESFTSAKGYLMIKIPKTPVELADDVNTVMSMGQKRGIVAAVVQATMATEIFENGEDAGDNIPPNKSVTKEEDPMRVQVFRSFFANAAVRGFDNTTIEKNVKEKLKLTSLKDASTNQIREMTEYLITTYKEVGKGQMPEKLVSQTRGAAGAQVAS